MAVQPGNTAVKRQLNARRREDRPKFASVGYSSSRSGCVAMGAGSMTDDDARRGAGQLWPRLPTLAAGHVWRRSRRSRRTASSWSSATAARIPGRGSPRLGTETESGGGGELLSVCSVLRPLTSLEVASRPPSKPRSLAQPRAAYHVDPRRRHGRCRAPSRGGSGSV